MERAPEPVHAGERELLLGWLAFHRDALAAKCAGLTDEQLVLTAAAPSDLSLLGLVRHLTEMERVYGVWALSGGGARTLVYCTDDEPDGDIVGLTAAQASDSLDRWHRERAGTDELLATAALDAPGAGNNRSTRWNLIKLMQEYARHNGHADLLRQRIDGATGE